MSITTKRRVRENKIKLYIKYKMKHKEKYVLERDKVKCRNTKKKKIKLMTQNLMEFIRL